MVTLDQVKQMIGLRTNRTYADGDIAMLLLNIDQDAIRSEVGSHYTSEIWDKVSPINGVPAEQVIATRSDVGAGPVYLVKKDGQISLFQPFHPAGEEMNDDNVEQIAQEAVTSMVDSQVAAAVTDKVLAGLANATPTGVTPFLR